MMDIEDDLASLDLCGQKKRRVSSNPESSTSTISSEDISTSTSSHSRRKSARIRTPTITYDSSLINKRRVLTKPKKISIDTTNQKDIENYYLDKRVKRATPALETIFEEPHSDFMSARKFKRLIQFFDSTTTKPNNAKIKKRQMKVKALSAHKRVARQKVTLESVKKYLADSHALDETDIS